MAKDSQQSSVSRMVEEARARQRADEDARHVMGVVPIIELAIVAPVVCLVAAVLVALFR